MTSGRLGDNADPDPASGPQHPPEQRRPDDASAGQPPHPALGSGPAVTVRRVAPVELLGLLHGPTPPVLVDVRPREQRAISHLAGDRWIPAEELSVRGHELPRDRSIVLYCHHGGTAGRTAELLRASGRTNVAVLDGGIDEYARLVDPTVPRYRDLPSDRLVLQQFPNLATGCLAYLLRDRESGEAVVVDPGREIAPYLRALSDQNLRLRAIVETHTHADHLSGHAELHARTDAPIWLSRRSQAHYPHRTLVDGAAIDLGGTELRILETPGHTDDHLSIRADGAVLTGDTLLPGSCGRTDLGTGDPELLWESLTAKLMVLPDETEVFPAHYGSRHGLPPPERYASTIGFERRSNEALLQPSREAFLAYMTGGWPPKPTEFERIVRTNLEE